ncbi:MAG: hypothetical protein ACREJP_08950 [Candidatus Methylomirabilales bacterium]
MPLQRSNVDAGQVEALVKKHFGGDFTCFVTRDHPLGRYVKAASPDVVARPRKVLFLTLGYEVIGEFKSENGDVFEFYRDWEADRARAFVEEYKRALGHDLRLQLIG